MKIKPSDLWRWDGTIDRITYLLLGLALFAVKFALDSLVSWYVFGQPWSISDYRNPGMFFSPNTETNLFLTLWAISLPFLWSGLVLTLRRLRSAGLPPWLVVFFVVPVLKLIFFAMLCLLPSRKRQVPEVDPSSHPRNRLESVIPEHSSGSAAAGIAVAIFLAVVATWLGTTVFQDYGWSLFVGLPFCMGFVSTFIYGLHRRRTLRSRIGVALSALGLAGVALLAIKIEGLICLIMAAPLAIILALAGALVAHIIQVQCRWRDDSPKLFCSVLLVVPFVMGLEHYQKPGAPLLEVTSSVVVNAPPEKVWRNVITFSELPPPKEWLFLAGVAYPIRAEIRGQGRGAIRYCNFCTGPFVEPIEVWDEPRLLKFSVTDNPAPMRELSPYPNLHPPHLHGFLVSKEGQFQLTRLPDGRTLLEGTTWYQHHLWPARYWQIWSDYIIHRIHLRVLNHVKELSERDETVP